ncbi:MULTISPECIES: CHASE3 domain-containing protein [unclassified Limnobacter]|uniref:sensor histidine kinase n=1 Tax=unclassified Limnobacter TaxID=2630203 RepID=UPI000C49271B|nr:MULTISPECIES: CHASE3 domain-containing protein [unclassified Limnobacter]MAG80263.1 histidine kinase [Sutterellaceae bacterium]MBA4315299.1 histidine kinase [Alcaligenaceae bacterium]MBT83435.1 histidine kinase [Sutterellaceae bacterium]|tara:strand:+ start:4810 stop:6144 length:1335 start_codon:yes stop_codon:yes gene_type:complete
MPSSVKRQIRPYWLLAFGCVMVLALLGITYTHSRMNAEVVALSDINQKRIDRLDQLWVLLVDAQASALSFLLMRNDIYLEPYRSAAARLEPLMASMNFDIPPGSDDHADLQDLKRLVDAKFQYLGDMLSQGKAPVAVSEEHGELGKQLMDEIRVRLAILKARREKAHQDLENMYLARAGKIQYVGYALGAASLLLILSLFVVQQRQVALRARIQELLKTENSRLEAKVQARTVELSNLATNLTTAQEAERQHIARELHDEMGSALTAAKMDASWLRRSLGAHVDDSIQERMLRLIENIGSTISLTRRLVDDLQPPLLKGLGLVEALRSLGQQFEIDMPVEMHFSEHSVNLSPEQSLALFRVAQESLTNVRKYAKASKVELSLIEQPGMVVLSVRDNGIGFNTDNIELHGHGIAGMKHRAQMFNARLVLASCMGQGTRIEVHMPI